MHYLVVHIYEVFDQTGEIRFDQSKLGRDVFDSLDIAKCDLHTTEKNPVLFWMMHRTPFCPLN